MPASEPRPAMTLRAQLAAIAERMEVFRGVDASMPLTVTFRRNGAAVRIVIRSEELAALEPSDLTPMEEGLLRVATLKPQSLKTLARLAGYKPGSVGKSLTALCRKRLLVRTPDGYCLVDGP